MSSKVPNLHIETDFINFIHKNGSRIFLDDPNRYVRG